MPEPPQRELFPPESAPTDAVAINARCLVRTQDGHRVVLVAGMPIAHYAVGDAMAEAHAVVSLIDQGWADQIEVARAFGRDERSVRRYQRRFEEGGLAALGRPGGYPLGRPRTDRARARLVSKLRGEGKSLRQIADRVGVTEKAIRKQLRRLGWPATKSTQAELPLTMSAADPNLSGSAMPVGEPVAAAAPTADPNLSGSAMPVGEPVAAAAPTADPNLSGSGAAADDEPLVVSADRDPANRWMDRLFAKLGLLDDAAPLFRDGERVPRAGVLLALPAIAQSGVVDTAREIYGSIGPAFYGLRTTIVALVFLALLTDQAPRGAQGARAPRSRSPARPRSRARGEDLAAQVDAARRVRPRHRVRPPPRAASRSRLRRRDGLPLP